MENNEKIQQKIEKWKQDLLDLSLRNRLINFQPGKHSTLRLIEPSPDKLFESVVVRERSMNFLPLSAEELTEVDSKGFSKKLKVTQLLTDREGKEMDLALSRLKLKARTSLQDQGINPLFMAFGFLKWKDAFKNNDYLLSPLLLVPVGLKRVNIASLYEVSMLDDEVVFNPALAKKLLDFGLDLTSVFDSESELDRNALENVFDRVSKTVASLEGWEIVKQVWLGLLSFTKLAMYKDLERFPQLVANSPVLRTIAEGKSDERYISGQDEVVELDKIIDPLKTYQILDADSSQQEAILAVKSGMDLVIQGPPGTGKSQTIANIIAESLGQGKKVLFVSEKMAALEVVKRRLDSCGLGDFCFELHSKKTGKRVVLEELDRTLKMAGKHALDTSRYDSDLNRFKSIRDKLNAYALALHEKRSKLAISAFELHGELAVLEKVPSLRYSYNEVDTLTRERLAELEYHFDQLGRYPLLFKNYKKNVLGKIKRDTSDPTFIIELRKSLEDILDTLEALGSLVNGSSKTHWVKIKKDSIELARAAESLSGKLDNPSVFDSAVSDSLRKLISLLVDTANELPQKYRKILEKTKVFLELLSSRLENIIGHFKALTGGSFTRFESIDAIEEMLRLLEKYRPEILSLDHSGLIQKFNGPYQNWLGRVLFDYKKNINLLKSLSYKGNLDLIVIDLGAAARVKASLGASRIQTSEPSLLKLIVEFKNELTLYKELIPEAKTSLLNLGAGLAELDELLSCVVILPWGNDTIPLANQTGWLEGAITLIKKYKEQLAEITSIVDTKSLVKNGIMKDFNIVKGFFSNLKDSSSRLDEWVSLKKSLSELEKNSLKDFLNKAIEENVDAESMKEVFQKSLYVRLLSIFYEQSTLKNFSGKEYNTLVESFRKLDEKQLTYSRKRLKSILARRIPATVLVNSGSAETSILLREVAKKRRNKSIRRLFCEIPNLLQTLKPCMMMSPLSVSVFIDPEIFKFDVVMFDEASQVFPEDAVGAIMRGKQIIVVGDSKQLPPTSFFKIAESSEGDLEEDEKDTESLESILDECRTTAIPEKSLLWHYRSRHESLIAFSNHHFYKNKLNTFPSNTYEGLDTGIDFVFVAEGVYDRSKSRKNTVEAERIARLVMKHAREKPGVSLGVVAFSEAQQMCIIDQLELLRREDQSLENFFAEEGEEDFFVKNLENVQGDERDEMIFSVGYGKDQNGKLYHHFGPLNRSGGERRLNVAITRARQKVTVVSSIKSEDISKDAASPGVKVLREYLNYAQTRGEGDWPATEADLHRDFYSPFEENVFEELTAAGLTLHKLVGRSSYRVDLAVTDERFPGKYILGIECDGAMYNSAKTVRDRDRLRQLVLGRLGWKIIRIWSRDWIIDKRAQITNVLKEVEKALDSLESGKVEPTLKVEEIEETLPKIERIETSLPVYEKFSKEDLHVFARRGPLTVESLIEAILEKETPVHIDEVLTRLIELLDSGDQQLPEIPWNLRTKSNKLSRKKLKQAITTRIDLTRYALEGEFIIEKNSVPFPRVVLDKINLRKPERIPPLEIRQAAKVCLRNAFSMAGEDLKAEVSRLFGYKRLGSVMSESISKEIDNLLKNDEIEIDVDKFKLSE